MSIAGPEHEPEGIDKVQGVLTGQVKIPVPSGKTPLLGEAPEEDETDE